MILIFLLSLTSTIWRYSSNAVVAFHVYHGASRTVLYNELDATRARAEKKQPLRAASLNSWRRKRWCPPRQAHRASRRIFLPKVSSAGLSLPNLQPFHTRPLSAKLPSSAASLPEATQLPENNVGPDSIQSTHDSNKVMVKDLDESVKQKPLPSSSSDELFRLAPPLTFDKFLTMQEKRVVVTICYSAESGLRPYFLSAAKRIKAAFPDVLIERRILPSVSNRNNFEGGEDPGIFEILVDGKEVIGKVRSNRNVKFGSSSKPTLSKKIVFVSMENLGVAISRARRRRRPNTSYLVADENGEPKLGIGINSSKRRMQNTNYNKTTASKNNAAALRLDAMRKFKQEKVTSGSSTNRHYND